MRVLIVNTSERTGGAAVAAHRLTEALNNNGVEATMLVRDPATDAGQHAMPQADSPVVSTDSGLWARRHFLWERLVVWWHLHCKRKHLFALDIANSGIDITRRPEFRRADVIHLHWVNQGMLSLGSIRKILRSGKPVVWTMHDIWPATAICHLTLGCRQFTTGCHHCKYLPGKGSARDLSARVWQRKKRLLSGQSISFVACSRWLEGEAKSSALLRGQYVTSIPNPIDTRLYCPSSQQEARQAEGLPADKRLLLFVCQRLTNPNKGMAYLIEACRLMAETHPESRQQIGIILLGGHADEVAGQLPFTSYPLGYVDDEERISRIYQAADAFVLPSLSENLPNTIMEAMACGVPCVAFRVGGIPEEIDHQKNGYVAEYRSSADLMRGLYWTLFEADREALSAAAVKKVLHNYSQASVAMRYIEVYQHALAQKHFLL